MLKQNKKQAIVSAIINNQQLPKEAQTEQGYQLELKVKEFMKLVMEVKHPFDIRLVNQENEVAFVWAVEDVQGERPDLTDEQAMTVLKKVKDKHDATVGVNWDVLKFWANELFPLSQFITECNKCGQPTNEIFCDKCIESKECFTGCECGCGKCLIFYDDKNCPYQDDEVLPECRRGDSECKNQRICGDCGNFEEYQDEKEGYGGCDCNHGTVHKNGEAGECQDYL